MLLRSGTISADEALQWGLVTQVFPDDELRAGAIAIAEQIMRTESRTFVQMLKSLKQKKPL